MHLKRYLTAVAALGAAILSACGDPLQPTLIPLPDEASEEVLVQFSEGDLTENSAFDMITAAGVRTDQTLGWDFVFDLLPAGTAVLWPRSSIIGTEESVDAGLALMDTEFDSVREAPEGGYTTLESVAIEVGDVFAVQSRRDPTYGSIRCRRYGKIEILELNASEGSLTLRHLVNPNCEKRTLVPGAEE